jgi:hypothetical protein
MEKIRIGVSTCLMAPFAGVTDLGDAFDVDLFPLSIPCLLPSGNILVL